ncbi:MAG: alpha/beta hydrolase [Gammaproteobacteria bacterium]|nr:alpha/beta hydrolase [Gammaproteobacteria bacterium]
MKMYNKALLAFVAVSIIIVVTGCSPAKNLRNENISTVTSTDGSAITYGVRGQGDMTIIFVHCWTCNHEFWRPQIEYFSQKYKVAWLDLAGHGLSGSNRQEYTMAAFGEDVVAVVNEIKGKNIVLVGHSMGGPVVIEAAKILGNKVIAVVGVDTFYTPFKYPKSEAKISEFVKPFEDDFKGTSEQLVRSMFTPKADPKLITSIINQMANARPSMGISAMYEIFRWNAKNVPSTLDMYSKKLRNINGAPTGEEKALHKSVNLIPGVGHFVAQVKPNEFNKALNQIIAEYQLH